MGAYTIRRLLWIPVTVILTTMIVFLLVRFIPGNIIDLIASEMGAQGQTIDRAALMHIMGLDAPVYVQYGRWVANIFIHGSFGNSLTSQNPITPMITQRVPLTFELGLMALIIGLIISLPIGVYSAIRQDTTSDYILRSISILLISVPSFWIGTMLILYSSIWFHWTPSMVYIPFTKNPMGNLGMMIIPAAILGSQQTGSTMRMTRTMMLETLRQDYIRTAWSKGLSERIVVVRHAMKNALIPVVTMVGGGIPGLVGGSVIIEQIFNLPGMGRLMMDALQLRDYPIISAVNLIMASIVIANNLFIDLTYGWLDPRIHYQ
ncbi:MAG: ABC transporter permease [Dehalococcoidales bacterium]